MSYWIYLEIDTGNGEAVEAWSANYTSNVSPMWRKALQGAVIGSVQVEALYDLNGLEASACVPALQRGVATMKADPATYEAMNPANGWGDADGARGVLEDMAMMCEMHPNCIVRVSH